MPRLPMRLGICCSPDLGPEYLAAGFDYVEMPAAVLAEDPRAYGDLPAEVTNVFFPGTIRLISCDPAPYRDHAKKVIEAAAAYGVTLMVLGSGTARTAPEGVGRMDAEDQFIDVAFDLDIIAQEYGIRVCPESLSKNETNVGNDLDALAHRLYDRGLGYTADAYHVLQEFGPNVNWEEQLPYPPSHVHFASIKRRSFQPDDPDLIPFFSRLEALQYDGRISFEGSLEGVPPAELLTWLRNRFGR